MAGFNKTFLSPFLSIRALVQANCKLSIYLQTSASDLGGAVISITKL